MTLPVPTEMTATVGQILTAVQWNNNVRDGINFLVNPPLFSGIEVATQSIPNAAFTAINFDTNVIDTYSGHSTTVNPSRYVAAVAGLYLIMASGTFAANATGRRLIKLQVNGVDVSGSQRETTASAAAGARVAVQTFMLVSLSIGDYVESTVFQNSGGALTLDPTSSCSPMMSAQWMHG